MRTFVIALLSLFIQLGAQAQGRENWKRYTTEDFRIYYQDDDLETVRLLAEELKPSLFDLQSRLNYYLNDRVDVFVSSRPDLIRQLRMERTVLTDNLGGFIDVRQSDVKLWIGNEPYRLLQSFRQQSARVIFNEMMFGGSLQDQMRSANLVYLPDWVESGLMYYLGNGWDAESDSRWRSIYERYGIRAFNRIPAEYDALKGASFFKFINDQYGPSALSNLLYMSRLTRKFHTAMFYAFQKSASELYTDWWEFFDQAYTIDQRKRLPVNGLNLDEAELLDLAVVSTDRILVLRTYGGRLSLEEWDEGGRHKVLKQLPRSATRLGTFHGALQVEGNTIHWFVYQGDLLRQITLTEGEIIEREARIPLVHAIRMWDGVPYLLCAGLSGSSLWKWEGAKPEQQWVREGFVSDIALGQHPVLILQALDGSSLAKYTDGDTLIRSSTQIEQPIVRDSFLYYLSNSNGVFNAKRLNLNSGRDVYLTDYRSDILYHSFAGPILVEYIGQLDRSALYVSEFGDEPEMICFDTIRPTYFQQQASAVIGPTYGVDETYVPDSLPAYTLQTAFPPGMDFTNSNYDSLKAVADRRSQFIATQTAAMNRFKRHSIFVQLYNEHNGQSSLPFGTGLTAYTPNRIGLRLGGTILNQFNDQMLLISGLFMPRVNKEYDLSLRYKQWNGGRPRSIYLMYRKRIFRSSDWESLEDQSSFGGFEWEWFKIFGFSLQQDISVRYDQQIKQGQERELLQRDPVQKGQLHSSIQLVYASDPSHWSNWKLGGRFKLRPFVNLPGTHMGLDLGLDLYADRKLLSWLDWESELRSGVSWGKAPTFFVLGGTSSDLLSSWQGREFSSYFEPTFYQMVYGIRGFKANYRNGTSFGTSSFQIGIRPIDLLVNRPVYSAFLNSMRLVAFVDMGYSMYGKSYYERSNALNIERFTTPGSSFTIQVRNMRNPFVASSGFGLHTQLYSYKVALDWAYGYENGNIQEPMLHLSLSKYLRNGFQ